MVAAFDLVPGIAFSSVIAAAYGLDQLKTLLVFPFEEQVCRDHVLHAAQYYRVDKEGLLGRRVPGVVT